MKKDHRRFFNLEVDKHIYARKRIFGKFHYLVAITLLIGGLALRVLHTVLHNQGIIWEILGEIGSFLALIFALHLIYEIYIKREEREIFIGELIDVLGKYYKNVSRVEKFGIKAIYSKLPITFVGKKFKKANSIKILQTWMGSADNLQPALKEALKNTECNVKILLLDPASPQCTYRDKDLKWDKLKDDRTKTKDKINGDLSLLKELADNPERNGTIEVRLYDNTPTVPIFAWDNFIFFGQMLRTGLSINGCYFLIDEGGKLGNHLSEHFNDLWESNDNKSYLLATPKKKELELKNQALAKLEDQHSKSVSDSEEIDRPH